MSELQRWEQLRDAVALEEDVSADDAAWLGAYDDPNARDERAAYAELAAAGQAADVDASARQRALDTVADFVGHAPHRRRNARLWIGAGAAVLAAVAVLLLSWIRPSASTLGHPVDRAAIVTSGTLMLDEAALGAGAALPHGQWVVARTPTCVRTKAATSCVSESARLRARDDALEIASGELHFTGTGQLVTPFVTVAATDASFRLHASTGPAPSMWIEGESGEVHVLDGPEGDGVLAPGDRRVFPAAAPEPMPAPTVDPPEPEPRREAVQQPDAVADSEPRSSRRAREHPAPSAGDLLATARAHVAQGRRAEALATYASLQRRYPSSAEARAAHVSIGQLQLDRGRSKAALRAFERYLAIRSGPLTEEAHWGRIRALHRLGRTEARDAAIETLRQAYPRSVYLNLARAM